MVNPIKVVKAVKNFPGGKKGRAIENKVRKEFGMSKGGTTAGKAKSVKKREVAYKNVHTMQGQGGYSVFNKATSNKKLGASNRAGRGSLKSEVKKMIKEEKKAGFSWNPKWHNSEIKTRRTRFQFSAPNPKVPVKRRGK